MQAFAERNLQTDGSHGQRAKLEQRSPEAKMEIINQLSTNLRTDWVQVPVDKSIANLFEGDFVFGLQRRDKMDGPQGAAIARTVASQRIATDQEEIQVSFHGSPVGCYVGHLLGSDEDYRLKVCVLLEQYPDIAKNIAWGFFARAPLARDRQVAAH
jgi:hypothetical protein